MNESSTLNSLVLYLYNETEMTETVLVQKAIDFDPETAETFEDLKVAKALIESTLLTPSKASIQSIMAYSRITATLQMQH